MKVIKPQAISLLATNVAANTEAEWSAGTTYALGALVKVTTSVPHKVYRSLRGNNTNRAPADWIEPQVETASSTTSLVVGTGAKTLTVQTGKGFAPGMIVSIAQTTIPRTVNMAAEVVSYTSGTGALSVSVYAVTGEGTHATWTITTEDEIGFWEEVSSTEQYKMFDEYVNSKTARTNSIEVELAVDRIDYVSLFGLLGNTVEFSLWDETETVQHWGETFDLVYSSALIAQISNWWEYFFGDSDAKTECSAVIPILFPDAVLKIKVIAEAGTSAECGNVVIGRGFDIGEVQYGARAGILDFSTRETDDVGRTTLVQGYWSKRNELTLRIPNYRIDWVYRLLSQMRGVATAWIGVENGSYEALIVYGAYREFDITVAGPLYSWCQLDIEGLI